MVTSKHQPKIPAARFNNILFYFCLKFFLFQFIIMQVKDVCYNYTNMLKYRFIWFISSYSQL